MIFVRYCSALYVLNRPSATQASKPKGRRVENRMACRRANWVAEVVLAQAASAL